MKRFSSSDSLDALVYPPQERKKNQKNNVIYSNEFQAMLDGLDEDDSTEENTQISEKKRRLSYDQVKALERIFAVDNKLDPERKTNLAEELGLQPRQIAIWFQNRRARWKTKQLERDYNLLKANYEALKLNYDKVQQEKEDLIAELSELKSKVGVKNTEENYSVEEKALFLETEHNVSQQSKNFSTELYGDPKTINTNHEFYNNRNLLEIKGLVDFKDGLSNSDSSGILNLGSLRHDCFQFSDSRLTMKKEYEQQLWNFEEQSLIIADEPCNIFSVDQAPKLHCYYYTE